MRSGPFEGAWRAAAARSRQTVVIIGVNRDYEHGGRHYHIQAEDLGAELQCFEVRVYDAGTVLWSKRISYGGAVAKDLPKTQRQEALQALIEKTLHTVEAAIAKGRLD